MPVTQRGKRQGVQTAMVEFAWDDLTDSVAQSVIVMPANSIVTGGYLRVLVVWDSVTSDAIEIGDLNNGGTADVDRYSGSGVFDLDAAVATFQLTPVGFEFTQKDAITLEVNSVGGSLSAGNALLVVEYMINDANRDPFDVTGLRQRNYGWTRHG